MFEILKHLPYYMVYVLLITVAQCFIIFPGILGVNLMFLMLNNFYVSIINLP